MKFAEAKNGVLLTINITSIFSILTSMEKIQTTLYLECYLFVSFSFLSLILCFISYMPNIKTPSFILGLNSRSESPNLLFYSDISELSKEELLSELDDSTEEDKKYTVFENHLAEQIIINSRITVNKYGYFTISLFLTFIAFFLSIILFLVF